MYLDLGAKLGHAVSMAYPMHFQLQIFYLTEDILKCDQIIKLGCFCVFRVSLILKHRKKRPPSPDHWLFFSGLTRRRIIASFQSSLYYDNSHLWQTDGEMKKQISIWKQCISTS